MKAQKPIILILYGMVLCLITWTHIAMSMELARRGKWMKTIELRLDALESK